MLLTSSETVECTGRRVQVSIAARQTRREDQKVDKMRKAPYTQILDTNDPRRGGSGALALVESTHEPVIVGAADDADSQDTDNVKPDESIEDELGDARDGPTRVLDLSCGDGNHVWASNGEAGVENHFPPTKKTAEGARGIIAQHGAVIGPVSKAVRVAFGISAAHGDNGDADEAEEKDDFQ